MTGPLSLISVLLTFFLAGGLWVGFSLFAIGIISLETFKNIKVDRFLAGDIWGTATAVELVTLPLFILMGEILFRTRLSENLFSGLAPLCADCRAGCFMSIFWGVLCLRLCRGLRQQQRQQWGG